MIVTAQPRQPVVLSRLAESLGFETAWLGIGGTAAYPKASRQAYLTDFSGVTAAANAERHLAGKTFSGSGTGQIILPVSDTTQCTFVAIYSDLTGGASLLGRLMSTYNGAGGHDVYCDGVSLHLQTFFSGGSSQRSLSVAPGTGSVPVCLAWSTDGATSPTSVASVDGAASTVTVSANTSGSRLAGGTVLGIGGRPDTTSRQIGGRVYLAARSRYALDQATLDRISARPWQTLLERVARPSVMTAGAAAGITGPLIGRGRLTHSPLIAGRLVQ